MNIRTVWKTALLCFSLSIPVSASEFTDTNGSIPEFISVDVGIPGIDPLYEGSTIYTNSRTFQMKAGGTDIAGTADAFQFAYVEATGDFDLRIRITNLRASDPHAKAGLVLRSSTNANAAGIYYMVTPTNNNTQILCGYRSTDGGSMEILASTTDAQLPPAIFPNVWLRIVRAGDYFRLYRSTNRLSWTFENSVPAIYFPGTVVLGLGLTAHDNSPSHFAECEADQFSLSYFCTCFTLPELRYAMVGDELILSWDAQLGMNYRLVESNDLVSWTDSDAAVEINWETDTAFMRVVPIGTKFYQLQSN